MGKVLFIALGLLIVLALSGLSMASDAGSPVPAKDKLRLSEAPGDAYIALGNKAAHEGHLSLARQLFMRAAEVGTGVDKAKAQHNLGVLAYQENDYGSAAKWFHDAITTDKNYARGYYSLGLLRYKQSRHEESIVALRTYTELAPSDPHGFFDLGIVSVEHARFGEGGVENLEEALGAFETAARLDPNFLHASSNARIVEAVLADLLG